MAVRYYEEALIKKIRSWIKDPNLRVMNSKELKDVLSLKADQINDQNIKLPLITISRNNSIKLQSHTKKPLTFDGIPLNSNKVNSIKLNAIPMELNFQIDIYTRYEEEADEYVRNFVFNIINHPKLIINIPYNDLNLEYLAYMTLNESIEDNSSVQNKLFRDQFARWTLNVSILDANFFSVPLVKNITAEEGDIEIKEAD